ncbi:MAG: GTPase ObgE [Myxococcales bacterium]|nr:GTPase ObgE [Myxococcales bacterium]MCB9577142.1 GTPase ObgE [Polyangiaceae bacterium]
MRFIDECELTVEAGDGGRGVVAFRREKYVPFGGPAGGDGGRGGDVVLEADSGKNTLYDLKHVRIVRADRGQDGGGKDKYGRAGSDRVVRVPLGTIVFDADSGNRLCELTKSEDRFVVASGGKGGRGNKHFATPVDRAPRKSEPGGPGEKKHLRLELKVMADVGLLGFPNVGKSTLIRAVSRARPKVADYPFTTLVPHLGVVHVGDTGRGLGRTFVIADIPGLIPGASEGTGLGIRFLRHVERTRVLLHLVTFTGEPNRSPLDDYKAIRAELSLFNPDMIGRPELVAMTKADLPDVQDAYEETKAAFAAEGIELRLVSAATHEGLDDLMHELSEMLML